MRDDEDPASGSSPSENDPGGSGEASAGLDPIWFKGLVYAYNVEHAPTGEEGILEFLVLETPDGSFSVEPVDDENGSLWPWVHYWDLPPLGPVDEGSLEPQRNGTRLDWFMFPIEREDTWEGTGPDGRGLTFSAEGTEVELPDGDVVPAFEVTGTNGQGASLAYTYTAQIGWFVSLSWDATGDGEAEMRFTLDEVRVEPDWQERPAREPARLLDLKVAGADVAGLPGLPGAPVEYDHGFSFAGEAAAHFIVRFEGETGFYYAQLDFEGEEEPFDWQWVNDGSDRGRFMEAFAYEPGEGDAAASMFVAGNGTATLKGVQMVPIE